MSRINPKHWRCRHCGAMRTSMQLFRRGHRIVERITFRCKHKRTDTIVGRVTSTRVTSCV